MAIPLGSDGMWDLSKAKLSDIQDEYAGRILEAFVTEGGKGLRFELRNALAVALQWKAEQDEVKKQKK